MKKILAIFYWTSLVIIIFLVSAAKLLGIINWKGVLHLGYYLPALGMVSIISGQIDLLKSIKNNGLVNLKARIYDFIHWLMLVSIDVGYLLSNKVTLGLFVLKLVLLAIIGWQIGAGMEKRLELAAETKKKGIIFAVAAVMLGLASGHARTIDQTYLGWGWMLESATAIIATLIVAKWILADLGVIKKNYQGYPRGFFIKGIISN